VEMQHAASERLGTALESVLCSPHDGNRGLDTLCVDVLT